MRPKLKIVKPQSLSEPNAIIRAENFNAWFGTHHVLSNLSFEIPNNEVTCIIGPSGSGKSTLIRSLNRINDDISEFHTKGELHFDGLHVYNSRIDTSQLRQKIGMVFQKPCVFPHSIADNVLFGLGNRPRAKKEKALACEPFLKDVFLWSEVAHRLHEKASILSIGQQQRLCIARSLAIKPKLLLLDEPTSALDPVATKSIEQLIINLKKTCAILFVTHNIQQAKRIADRIIFMCDGKIIEQDLKEKIFSKPRSKQTAQYLKDEICEC